MGEKAPEKFYTEMGGNFALTLTDSVSAGGETITTVTGVPKKQPGGGAGSHDSAMHFSGAKYKEEKEACLFLLEPSDISDGKGTKAVFLKTQEPLTHREWPTTKESKEYTGSFICRRDMKWKFLDDQVFTFCKDREMTKQKGLSRGSWYKFTIGKSSQFQIKTFIEDLPPPMGTKGSSFIHMLSCGDDLKENRNWHIMDKSEKDKAGVSTVHFGWYTPA